jgi:hypothetical protein
MAVMEEDTFIADILPPPRCEYPPAAKMEGQFLRLLTAYETFDDDKVPPDFSSFFTPAGRRQGDLFPQAVTQFHRDKSGV